MSGGFDKRTPLSLLHGFMGDPSDWDLIRSQFAEHQIVTPFIQPADDWASGLANLADRLPERSVIVGYSMGARLGLALALAYPDRCAGLVFCSGNPGISDPGQRELRYARDCEIAHQIENQKRDEFLHHWYTESTVFQSLTDRVRADEIRRKLARCGDDWGNTLRTYSVAKQPDFWPKLGELKMPVVAIAGLLDRKYTRIITQMGTYKHIQTRVVAACGHIVHHEQPHVFAELLRSFLAENEAIS